MKTPADGSTQWDLQERGTTGPHRRVAFGEGEGDKRGGVLRLERTGQLKGFVVDDGRRCIQCCPEGATSTYLCCG